ncbi:LuxR C-terminal-related transcriptional regulator [Saccharicrinis sp. FJH54]|uniref:helix-turn-helix transcriptional regulator n=1 Tax=Saccharicrinis sp. FJH54 TaxID=3344665 RepID=UPI0035D4D5C5
MNYGLLIIWLFFVFCAALSVTGVLLLFRLKQKHKGTDFRQIHYAMVLLYTFGFYVLWGKLFIRIILPETSYANNNDMIQNVNQALGIPFMFAGFILLVYWIYHNSEIKRLITKLLSGTILVLVLTGIYIYLYNYNFFKNTVQINQILISLFSLWVAFSVLFYCKCIDFRTRMILATGFGVVALGNLALLFFEHVLLFISALNLVYFLVMTGFTVAVYYGFVTTAEPEVNESSADRIYKTYGITLREREVISEIQNGLTNQQIADKLFVTLQTVKDHNSRIYLKLGVKNRTQLVKLFHDQKR